MDEVFPGRPQSFRHQHRPVDDCSPGRGGMAQDGGARGGTFNDEIGELTIKHSTLYVIKGVGVPKYMDSENVSASDSFA